MANERVERVVQCCISLLLMLFFFPVGCSTTSGKASNSPELSDCSDCIQRVSRVHKAAALAQNTRVPGAEPAEPGEENLTNDKDGDANEPQTNEREEVIDLDHPEDNYHEVYASAEGVGGGPESEAEPVSVPDSEYSGALRWHAIAFQEAITRGIRDETFRNRDVSAAHCHFSVTPNKDTLVFAMLVRHTTKHGDVFYLGREGMAISRINTRPLVTNRKGRIELVISTMYCVYREDQNEAGALIFEFRDGGREPQFALVRVDASPQRQPTNRTMLVEEIKRDTRVSAASEVQVQVYEYVAAQSRVMGVFPSFEQALAEGEKVIPRGRFRLRVENTYPFMKWQSYFGVEDAEFCPSGVECRE